MSGNFALPSTWQDPAALHVALIMDGNGRWAARRGLGRTAGHMAGVDTVRRVVESAPSLGIGTLTLYAFSADNWRRPAEEVRTLMKLFERHLDAEIDRFRANSVRLNVIGRRDRLEPKLFRAVKRAESATSTGSRLLLRIAIDYSSRWAIAEAVRHFPTAGHARQCDFERQLLVASNSVPDVPAVDLLIRTSGEERLSDFLLWECAYAELHFTPVLWPDFKRSDLEAAVSDFQARERRFGALPNATIDDQTHRPLHVTQGGTL